jgi:Nucleotidyltransferase domain
VLRDAVSLTRRLVQQQFPQARAAWLGGSVATGQQTTTSDLDITVLLDGPPAPFRTSQTIDQWPVEFFVQTEESLMRFCAVDLARHRPTTMRLVGSSIVLVDTDGSGPRLQSLLHHMDNDGPPPSSPDELDGMRYGVSELLSDLTTAPTADECLTVAAALLREAGDLLLGANRRWSGSGKWLLREIKAFDDDQGTGHAAELMRGLRAAADGDPSGMRQAVLDILASCGGVLFDGFRRGAPQ